MDDYYDTASIQDDSPLNRQVSGSDDRSVGSLHEDTVRVFVRIRPLNKRELTEDQTIGWNFNESSMIEDTQNGQRIYSFDRCFAPNQNNSYVYEIVGKPIVLKTMEGFNGTVFSYGQTGSGKTWTMRGSDSDPGMMILCIRDIFDWIESHQGIIYSLKVSYLEVYNEEINDLLGDGVNSKNLRIVSEDAVRGAVIEKLIEHDVKTTDDFLTVLRKGESARQFAATNMNAESSRSHTIYRVVIEAKDKDDTIDSNIPFFTPSGRSGSFMHSMNSARISYLNLVDLAGSERQKLTNATGKTLKEGANINKSLLALGACISKLGEASKKGNLTKSSKPVFIPFRDSKLTRILKQSLAGNTMTSVLCAVTPASMHREETVSTLKFGQLCKTIKNNIKSMEVYDDQRLLKQYKLQIQELRMQLDEYQSLDGPIINRIRDLESYIVQNNLSVPPYQGTGSNLDQSMNDDQTVTNLSNSIQSALQRSMLTDKSNPTTTTTEKGSVSRRSSNNNNSIGNLKSLQDENTRLQEKLADYMKQLTYYERKIEEYHDFEETKIAFDDYEIDIRNELDEQRNKLEYNMKELQTEKTKFLLEKSLLEEKESRLGLLLSNLDEKESKLHQILDQIHSQQDHLNQNIIHLKKREEYLQNNIQYYDKKEYQLNELSNTIQHQMNQNKQKEQELNNLEIKLLNQSKELNERDNRLQLMLSQIATHENENHMKSNSLILYEKKLTQQENDLKSKYIEYEELINELKSYELKLNDKEISLNKQMELLSNQEQTLQIQIDNNNEKEISLNKKSYELKTIEQHNNEIKEKYQLLLNELTIREDIVMKKIEMNDNLQKQLQKKEKELKELEIILNEKTILYETLNERERYLNQQYDILQQKENEFYNHQVIEITMKHKQEIKSLEMIIENQLLILNSNTNEIKRYKERNEELMNENESLKQLISSSMSSKMNDEQHQGIENEYNEDRYLTMNSPSNMTNNSPMRGYSPYSSMSNINHYEDEKKDSGPIHSGTDQNEYLIDMDMSLSWKDIAKSCLDPVNNPLPDDFDSEEDDDRHQLRIQTDGYHTNVTKSMSRSPRNSNRKRDQRLMEYLNPLKETQQIIDQLLQAYQQPSSNITNPLNKKLLRLLNSSSSNTREIRRSSSSTVDVSKDRRGSAGASLLKGSVLGPLPEENESYTGVGSDVVKSPTVSTHQEKTSFDPLNDGFIEKRNVIDMNQNTKDSTPVRGQTLTVMFGSMSNSNLNPTSGNPVYIPPPPPPPPPEANLGSTQNQSNDRPKRPHMTSSINSRPTYTSHSATSNAEVSPSVMKSTSNTIKNKPRVTPMLNHNGSPNGPMLREMTGIITNHGYRHGVPYTSVTLTASGTPTDATNKRIIKVSSPDINPVVKSPMKSPTMRNIK